MSISANSILAQDISVIPIKLKYNASYSGSELAAANIVSYTGINGPVTSTGSVTQTTLNYLSVRHLYYSNYLTGSFPTTTSSYDNFLQSTAASGTLDADVRYFPTQSGATVQILSIPRNVFGERIARRSLAITAGDGRTFGDDGNGNLVETTAGIGYYDGPDYYNPGYYYDDSGYKGQKAGNVIYAQGMVIITNSNYQSIFT